jgi:nucleoside-diphosphate-sugar epimerase
MRLLLTGGTGFIGTAFRNNLTRKGIDFSFISSREGGRSAVDTGLPIQCDLLTEQGRIHAVETAKADTLIHLAWYAEPNNFWNSPRNLEWVAASLDLVQRFAGNGGKRCVVVGTCAEYDWSGGGRFSETETPLRPATYYGVAKDALRRVLQGYAAIAGLSFLWSRLFWPYGPGEPDGRLFSSLIKKLRNDQITTCRAGNLKRDYMHIDDIAEALSAATFSGIEGAVNIASGKAVSLGELATALAASMGKPELLKVGRVPTGPGNPEEIYADTDILKSVSNLNPRSIVEGIRTIL